MAFGKPRTPLTPEEKVERNRRRAIGLSVAAEAFKQGDPVGRALGMRQQFEQQAQQAEQEKINQQLNSAIDSSNIPETQKTFLKAMGVQQKYDALYGQKAIKREIREDVKGRPRFVDTRELLFPDVEMPQDKTSTTETERMQSSYNKLMAIPVEGRSDEDIRNIAIYETKLFGTPKVISFFNSEGKIVPEESITSLDLIYNRNILKEKAALGLSTIGQSPSITPKGATSVMTLVRDDYLGAKSQIDTINDLATIVEENKDTFTFAGSLANFVNSTKYQIQSAERLASLNMLKQNEKEFSTKLS